MVSFPGELQVDKGQTLIIEPSVVLLCFADDRSVKRITPPLRNLGIEVINNPGATHAKGDLINNTRNRFWVRTRQEAGFTNELLQEVQKAFGDSLLWIGPAYQAASANQRQNSIVCPLPHVVIVELNEAHKGEQKEKTTPDFETNEAGSSPRLKEITERSAYLNGRHYYEIGNLTEWNAYTVKNFLLQKFNGEVKDVFFDKMPLVSPLAFMPNDTYFSSQWNLAKINAPQGWDATTGNAAVIVAILDTGCDLTHPDLVFASQGVNCTTMAAPGSPAYAPELGHGTCCAGIAAASINNGQGVSGIAGSCKVLPLAIESFTDSELAFGINYAVNHGASVISMSWHTTESTIVDTALSFALGNDVVLCAAAGNDDISSISYPSSYAGVMSIAGTDENDNRKTAASPDGECWGSTYGEGLSVGAPCVKIWSTDIQGSGGFNDNGAAYTDAPCVTYPSAGDAAGNYFKAFNGTSSATPHVAGFVGLLRSQYPGLTGVQVKNIIERTAEKTGSTAYTENAAYPNGTWNNQLGYGRINLFKGLDFADVFIRDYPADTGLEPRTAPGGDFWDYGDLVVRPADDNFFNPSLLAQARSVVRGQTNYVYVRVTNNGPNAARNVVVNVRITPFVGTQFVAGDWTSTDATHVSPTAMINTFATLASGAQVIAKFSLSSSQVESLYGWETDHPWHPCMLAVVTADNDYAFNNADTSGGILAVNINNFAQRNLTVISAGTSSPRGFNMVFPFVAGNRYNLADKLAIQIDRSQLPKQAVLYLLADDNGSAFPEVNFNEYSGTTGNKEGGMQFMERTKILTKLGCCEGILTLEKGSRFDCAGHHHPSKISVTGGEVVLQDGKRLVRIDDLVTTVTISKNPKQLVPLSLQLQVNTSLPKGTVLFVPVKQLNENGQVVGGAGVAYVTE